jgi:hypothetical protein
MVWKFAVWEVHKCVFFSQNIFTMFKGIWNSGKIVKTLVNIRKLVLHQTVQFSQVLQPKFTQPDIDWNLYKAKNKPIWSEVSYFIFMLASFLYTRHEEAGLKKKNANE